MTRYIDADKLIAYLKDEIKACEPVFDGRANGKSVAYGTELGLKSAISFAETLAPADVAPKSEVARKICCEIEEEIVAALESNYRALKELDDGRCNDYILEMVNRIKGKIDALRGIEGFIAELKKKYTEEKK